MGYGKFVFRDFSAKPNIKKRLFTLQFNQFLGNEKSHSPNGRVICDLHSPDTFDTRLGERASANVQPCKRVFYLSFFPAVNALFPIYPIPFSVFQRLR